MLNAVTGVPGASKTAYVVTQLDEQERKNKINLVRNIEVYKHNKQYIEKFKDDFSYVEEEQGSGHELKTILVILEDNYYDMLAQRFDDLRPDDYYVRVVRFNETIERLTERGEKHDLQPFYAVRTIYSNIKALKIDYVRALVIDWRTCPDGSIFAVDEVQLVPPYNDNKNKNDDIVQELTIHRHRGFDFWFITQSATYLHPTIKELISCHLHITRPYWRTPKVYQYGSLRQYPNTLINKLNCESKFTFKPKDSIFKLYKSTSIDTSKKRTPAGLYGFAAFIVVAICVFLYGLSGGTGFMCHFLGTCETKTDLTAQNNKQSNGSANNSPVPTQKDSDNLDLQCRKAVNVEKPECIQWFNDLSKNNGSVQDQSARNSSITYNPSKPFDQNIEQQLTYDATAKPVFSGCIKKNGKYVGYSQQGTVLNVSQDDCKRLLEDGDRPFNYFAQQQTERVSTSEQTQSASKTSPL
ncbi:zonular occludens toxin domain-containing protein [Acinetobacter beijerinckii]|uniref:zonular occludens toxin domain-containing protein n=1 Tax=Acinetobacter beijerinckii TaxID=262668 RepID=UPI00240740B2|nr:zonular occludens toxin domain-containing protein [Acinetobacter beijerinckii]